MDGVIAYDSPNIINSRIYGLNSLRIDPMPVNVTKKNGITTEDYAERLQVMFSSEDVETFVIEVFFKRKTKLNGEEVAPEIWVGGEPLRFTCENDPELKSALELIQARIGVKRYEQLTATPPENP